jgi:hypothetical protein
MSARDDAAARQGRGRGRGRRGARRGVHGRRRSAASALGRRPSPARTNEPAVGDRCTDEVAGQARPGRDGERVVRAGLRLCRHLCGEPPGPSGEPAPPGTQWVTEAAERCVVLPAPAECRLRACAAGLASTAGCPDLPDRHGKEGVAGSSSAEGLGEPAGNGGLLLARTPGRRLLSARPGCRPCQSVPVSAEATASPLVRRSVTRSPVRDRDAR